MRKFTTRKQFELRICALFLFNFVIYQTAFTQMDSIAFVFQDAIESTVAANDDNAFDYDTEFDYLQEFILHPININKAPRTDFENLKLLTPNQITAILEHREKQGNYMTLLELQSVLDIETIRRILPFIMVDGDFDDYHLPFREWLKRGKNEIIARYERRLEKAKGYLGAYIGDANKFYTRYRFSFANRLSYGLTFEKDAGEPYSPFLDFYSFHLKINNIIKGVKTLCLGDYSASLGQGLIHENGFNLGKSALALSIEKNSPPLKQYTSSNEANFLRGIAAQLQLTRHTEGVIFASFRKRDGNIIQPLAIDNADSLSVISALQYVGLHRTTNEREDKNAVGLITVGGRVLRTVKRGSMAFNAVLNHFDKKIDPRNETYNLFSFRGKSLLNVSGDYKYTYQNAHFFGETALSDNLGWATLNGLLLGSDKRLSFAFLSRFFSTKFQTINAQPFAESSKSNNEKGIYTGLDFKMHKRWVLSAYADFWQYPWWKFRVDGSSNGLEFFTKLAYRHKNSEGYLQVRTKKRQENTFRPDSLKVNELIYKTKTQIRFHWQNMYSKNLIFRNRLELSFYKDAALSRGFVIWQDVIFKCHLPGLTQSDTPLSISSRLAFFDTDNYQSAIYAFENDLMYSFNVTPYYYRGTRFYANISYQFNKKGRFEFRLARTYLANQSTIGSGNEEINAPQRTDLKMQLSCTF